VKKLIGLVISTLIFSSAAYAFGEGPAGLQEKAARVLAHEIGMTRAQINELKGIIAQNSPVGDLNKCSDYGYVMGQQMGEQMPSASEEVTDAIQDFATWGCVVKNGG
jgi:biotin operon repressor